MAGQTENFDRYPCRCCLFLTLSEPETGSYEICPVCFWEDDPVQNEHPEYAGGANKFSLGEARENYIRCGACDPALERHVWPPSIEEVRFPTIVQGLDQQRQAATLRNLKATLLGVVRALLSGRIAILEGCCAVAALGSPLNDVDLEDQLRLFICVASEADEFPAPATRHLWSQDALAVQDQTPSTRTESKAQSGTPAPAWNSDVIWLREIPAPVPVSAVPVDRRYLMIHSPGRAPAC